MKKVYMLLTIALSDSFLAASSYRSIADGSASASSASSGAKGSGKSSNFYEKSSPIVPKKGVKEDAALDKDLCARAVNTVFCITMINTTQEKLLLRHRLHNHSDVVEDGELLSEAILQKDIFSDQKSVDGLRVELQFDREVQKKFPWLLPRSHGVKNACLSLVSTLLLHDKDIKNKFLVMVDEQEHPLVAQHSAGQDAFKTVIFSRLSDKSEISLIASSDRTLEDDVSLQKDGLYPHAFIMNNDINYHTAQGIMVTLLRTHQSKSLARNLLLPTQIYYPITFEHRWKTPLDSSKKLAVWLDDGKEGVPEIETYQWAE